MIDLLFKTGWGNLSLLEAIFTAIGLVGAPWALWHCRRFGTMLWRMQRARQNGQLRAVRRLLFLVSAICLLVFALCLWAGFAASQQPPPLVVLPASVIASLLILAIEVLILGLVAYLEFVWRSVGGDPSVGAPANGTKEV
jgi:hypothetical protein